MNGNADTMTVDYYKEGHFRVGDMVTRDGTDLQRVIEADWHNGYAPDIITVECVKEPLGYLNDDGSRGEPWIRLGETETNLARRYSHAGTLVEVAMATRLTPIDAEPKVIYIYTPR